MPTLNWIGKERVINHHLDISYTLTCSNDFRDTLENIVKGLNKAGFSK